MCLDSAFCLPYPILSFVSVCLCVSVYVCVTGVCVLVFYIISRRMNYQRKNKKMSKINYFILVLGLGFRLESPKTNPHFLTYCKLFLAVSCDANSLRFWDNCFWALHPNTIRGNGFFCLWFSQHQKCAQQQHLSYYLSQWLRLCLQC